MIDSHSRLDVEAADVFDACEKLGVPVACTGALRPLWPDCPPVHGQIVTFTAIPAHSAPSPLPALLEMLSDSPDKVALIDLGGATHVQCWGAALAAAATRYGMRGALINGAARDPVGIARVGMPCYARAVHPSGVRNRLRLQAVGAAVSFGSQRVQPGDYVIADSGGAVFFPSEHRVQVFALARERKTAEDTMLAALSSGADPRELFFPRPASTD
jgi:4-hydroxy-4-methyl-2-oxoglutarate aldolase